MINNVVLVGRLTKDPNVQFTQGGNGVAFVNFTLAVNRTFTNSKGEREADFISCQIWRKGAENLGKYATKGSLIGFQGQIRTSSYEKNGQRIYRTDVVSDNFSLLESRQEAEARQQNNNSSQKANSYGNNPMNNQSQSNNTQSNNTDNDPFADNSRPIDISDDDLPF